MNKSIFTMMIGVPGSGKTTVATKIAKGISSSDNEKILLSSDALRLELFGDEYNTDGNDLVFDEMFRRTKDSLLNGKDVIYDATNLSYKRRRNLIRELKRNSYIEENVTFECCLVLAPIETCIYRDNERERTIGSKLIKKMYKNINVPMYFEGWDSIKYITTEKFSLQDPNLANRFDMKLINDYNSYIKHVLSVNTELMKSIDLAQDSSYHTFSVSRHMYYAYNWIKNITTNSNLIIATMLHDIGKPYCKVFKDEKWYANFYSHENVSAYLAIELLLDYGDVNISCDDITQISTYIQLHNRLTQIEDNTKAQNKLLKDVGEDLFNDLHQLYLADIQAK